MHCRQIRCLAGDYERTSIELISMISMAVVVVSGRMLI